MIKPNKATLQFAVAAILFLSFAVTGCNNEGEKKDAVKDEPATTTTAPPVVKDSIDTMEQMKGGVSPTPQGN